MQGSAKKIMLGPNSSRFTETKSPRGTRQQHQRFLPRSAFQPTQGKSRVVAQRQVREGNPFKKEAQPSQSSRESEPIADSAVPSNASSGASVERTQPLQGSPEVLCGRNFGRNANSWFNPTTREKRAQLYRSRRSSTCPEVTIDLSIPMESISDSVSVSSDSARSGTARSAHIARLPTRDLIDQVDERNNKIEELLRMGEATIAGPGVDASPLSKAESEDGETPSRRAERPLTPSWADLDLAADGVLKSIGAQMNAIAEQSDHSSSCSTRSQSSEDELEFQNTRFFKRSGSNTSQTSDASSQASHNTIIYRAPASTEDDQVSVNKRCIVGHDLQPHTTPSNRWWCSKCLNQVPEGTRLFGCRICNYDECLSCMGAANTQTQEITCEPCLAPKAMPQEAQDVLREEVALLQQQMSALRNQLRDVTQERNEAINQNQKLQNHVSRMWKATLSYSDFDQRQTQCIE